MWVVLSISSTPSSNWQFVFHKYQSTYHLKWVLVKQFFLYNILNCSFYAVIFRVLPANDQILAIARNGRQQDAMNMNDIRLIYCGPIDQIFVFCHFSVLWLPIFVKVLQENGKSMSEYRLCCSVFVFKMSWRLEVHQQTKQRIFMMVVLVALMLQSLLFAFSIDNEINLI